MRRWALVSAATVAVGLVVSGCSAKKTILPGVTVNQDGSGGSVTVKTDQGSMEISGGDSGAAKWPDGLPLKVFGGATITSSMKSTSNGKQGFTVSLTSKKDPKAAADFYEAELKGAGVKVDRNEIESDGSVMITLTGDGEKNSAWITITKDKGQQDVTIGIFWAQK
jgi:hypothetical protein